MQLTHVYIFTNNVKKLKDFYETVALAVIPSKYLKISGVTRDGGETYSHIFISLHTGGAIHITDDIFISENLISLSANKSVMFGFEISNIERVYERMKNLDIEIVRPLNGEEKELRIFAFRDPDGNIIQFYENPKKEILS